MKVVVIGGGSVGLLWTARLRQEGMDVLLLTRTPEQAEWLRESGLTLITRDNREMSVTVDARVMVPSLPEADLYLLCVKQVALPHLLPSFRSLPSHARVVCMQNGMGQDELLQEAVKAEQIFLAVNTEGARRLSPTSVKHTGEGTLSVGPAVGQSEEDPLVAQWVEKLRSAGWPVFYQKEIRPLLWRKLVANALINPLTALLEIPNGVLAERKELQPLMRQLFEEAVLIAEAEGIKMDEETWQEIFSICRNTSTNLSSMLQDLLNGKSTEIESINGYLVRKGKRHGMTAPTHELVRRLIRCKSSLRQ